MAITPAHVSAGASLLSSVGGLFGGKSALKQMRQQSDETLSFQYRQAEHLPEFQVAGFKKAGINPLFGLSGGSAQYSSPTTIASGGDTLGNKISNMGQNISRAAEAYATERERLNNRLLESQIDGQELENTKKASDIALKSVTTPGLNNMEGNTIPDVAHVRTGGSNLGIVMSQDQKDRSDEDFFNALGWNIRNRLLPSLGVNSKSRPSDKYLPKGHKAWAFNPFTQEYYPVKNKLGPLVW